MPYYQRRSLKPPDDGFVLTCSAESSASELVAGATSSPLEGAALSSASSVVELFVIAAAGLFVSAEYLRKRATAAKREPFRCAAIGRVRTAKALHTPSTRATGDIIMLRAGALCAVR